MKNNIEELKELVIRLRIVAEPIGPLHSWWDVIFDIEEFMKNGNPILDLTETEWIEYANKLLKKHIKT